MALLGAVLLASCQTRGPNGSSTKNGIRGGLETIELVAVDAKTGRPINRALYMLTLDSGQFSVIASPGETVDLSGQQSSLCPTPSTRANSSPPQPTRVVAGRVWAPGYEEGISVFSLNSDGRGASQPAVTFEELDGGRRVRVFARLTSLPRTEKLTLSTNRSNEVFRVWLPNKALADNDNGCPTIEDTVYVVEAQTGHDGHAEVSLRDAFPGTSIYSPPGEGLVTHSRLFHYGQSTFRPVGLSLVVTATSWRDPANVDWLWLSKRTQYTEAYRRLADEGWLWQPSTDYQGLISEPSRPGRLFWEPTAKMHALATALIVLGSVRYTDSHGPTPPTVLEGAQARRWYHPNVLALPLEHTKREGWLPSDLTGESPVDHETAALLVAKALGGDEGWLPGMLAPPLDPGANETTYEQLTLMLSRALDHLRTQKATSGKG